MSSSSQETELMAGYRTVYGDVNLRYGGLFVRDQGDSWAEVVEVTDLDSAVGTTNLVLVEQGAVSIPRRLAEARRRFAAAWSACGPGGGSTRMRELDRTTARLAAFAALWEYGHKDIERSWTIATHRAYDEWAGPDRWRVSTRDCYDERRQLTRSIPIRVNGEKGLRRWLGRTIE